MSATDQYLMEVSHSDGHLIEFKSVVPGQPVGLELGRKQWESLGFPGRLLVHVSGLPGSSGRDKDAAANNHDGRAS